MLNNKEMLDLAIQNMLKYPEQIELFKNCIYDLAVQGKIAIGKENSKNLHFLLEDESSKINFTKEWKSFMIDELCKATTCEKEKLQEGDILLPNRVLDKFEKSSVYFFREEEKYCYSTLNIIRPNVDKILPKFLFYIIKSSSFYQNMNHSFEKKYGTFPIRKSIYGHFRVSIPSLEEQLKIIEKIDDIDEKLNQLRKLSIEMETNSENLLKSLIKKMTFVDDKNK